MPVDEQAFAQLQKRLEVVEAKLALRQILDDYAHTLDRANLTRLDSDRNIFCNLHTKDVTFGHPISGLKGREALLALMQKQSHEDIFNTTLHCLINFQLKELDVEKGEAKGYVNAIFNHIYKPRPEVTNDTDKLRDYTQTGAIYDLKFRVEDGEWKISQNNLTPFWFNGTGPLY